MGWIQWICPYVAKLRSIYIYQVVLCFQAFKLLYIHIFWLYMPNPGVEKVCIGTVYMFTALFGCFHTLYNLQIFFPMFQGIIIYHFFPPKKRTALNSIQKQSLSTKLQGGSGFRTWLRNTIIAIYEYICIKISIYLQHNALNLV